MEKIEEVDDEAAHVPGELAQQTQEQLWQQLLTAYTAQIYPRISTADSDPRCGAFFNPWIRDR
jgi:hypothetical protein